MGSGHVGPVDRMTDRHTRLKTLPLPLHWEMVITQVLESATIRTYPHHIEAARRRKYQLTRMHSSRMRTGRSLTISGGGGVGENLETPRKIGDPTKNWRTLP